MKSIDMFHWYEQLGRITGPNKQVKLLNEVLLNTYSIFTPNQVKTIKSYQAPWITPAVKNFLRKKNHAYANFMKSGHKLEGI